MSEVQATTGIMRSGEIDKLAAALAKAQGEMGIPDKKRTATIAGKEGKQGYSYKYADLSDIRAAITPSLSKNELAVTQVIDAATMRLTTVMFHSSGQFLGSTFDLPRGLAPQAFGSALTYAKRYSLCSLTGIVAEDDDDGGGANVDVKRQHKVGKIAAAFKPPVIAGAPKAAQMQGSMLAPLTTVPQGMTREAINQRIVDAYPAVTKLHPNMDLQGEMFGRYAVTNRKDLKDDEAYDFALWMEDLLKKGVSA